MLEEFVACAKDTLGLGSKTSGSTGLKNAEIKTASTAELPARYKSSEEWAQIEMARQAYFDSEIHKFNPYRSAGFDFEDRKSYALGFAA